MNDSQGAIRDFLGWFGSSYYKIIDSRNHGQTLQPEVDNFMERAAKELEEIIIDCGGDLKLLYSADDLPNAQDEKE